MIGRTMQKLVFFPNWVTLFAFAAIVLPLTGLHAEEEFDFDAPPVNLAKPIAGIENIC